MNQKRGMFFAKWDLWVRLQRFVPELLRNPVVRSAAEADRLARRKVSDDTRHSFTIEQEPLVSLCSISLTCLEKEAWVSSESFLV